MAVRNALRKIEHSAQRMNAFFWTRENTTSD
jgi:hypothetical protein